MTDHSEATENDLMTLRARIPAPPARVHRALTDASELRVWLAEQAEVALPDQYAFWGRSVPEGDAPHQHPLHVDEHTVRFGWRLEGQHTTTEFGLAPTPDADATLVTLTQSHLPSWADMLAERGSRALLHTFWSLAVANLADHLAGRRLTPRADLTSPTQRAAVDVAAPAERVWAALTDGAAYSRWFGARVDIEPRLGGRFAMGGFEADPDPATITEFADRSVITVAWADASFSWELAESAGRTHLTFTQSGFDPTRPPYGSWLGWLAGVAELRRFCELADWEPLWQEIDVPGLLVEQS